MEAMKFGYGKSDKDFIEYTIVEPKIVEEKFGSRFRIRCPSTVDNPRIVFIGAAQTFGRYTTDPYPTLISRNLNTSILNISRPGGAPSTWLDCEELIKVVNQADLLVYQILSARATGTSLAVSESGGKQLTHRHSGKTLSAESFLLEIMNENMDRAIAYVDELRRNYIEDTKRLLTKVEVPIVGFWFSKREPGKGLELDTLTDQLKNNVRKKPGAYEVQDARKIMRPFPQYVDQDMMNEICNMFSETVYCVSKTGLPQTLMAKDGSGSVRKNNYYPSPEMHAEAAEVLSPVCKKYLIDN